VIPPYNKTQSEFRIRTPSAKIYICTARRSSPSIAPVNLSAAIRRSDATIKLMAVKKRLAPPEGSAKHGVRVIRKI